MQKNISDYIGKRYGNLTVIGLSASNSRHPYCNHFDFKCDCGNIISDEPARVISGHRTSCGKCQYRKKEAKPRFNIQDYLGKKENLLTVVGIAERLPNDKCWYLKCKCDCGNFTRITPHQFNKKAVKSCGCLNKRGTRTIDNRSKHPLYGIWTRMIDRCENPKCKHYGRYGGRGISVCVEWHDFWKFVSWSDSVGGRPNGYTLDRIDNDGNYCPDNCRWANWDVQTNNKSSNVLIEYNGKVQTVRQWAVEKGMHHQTLLNRINRGWDIEKALNTPVQNRIKSKSV